MPTPQEITTHHDAPEGVEVWVGPKPEPRPIEIVPFDPAWSQAYRELASRVRNALGDRVLGLQHIGSTAVPGLPAKPVIDLDLTLADPAAEHDYVQDLQRQGFVLSIREPHWHEHRVLTSTEPRANLHVFGPDCPEVIRHAMFRDWLIAHPDDLLRYRDAKLAAAADFDADGGLVMQYNAKKQPVIREILDRMFRAHGLLHD